MPIWVAAAIRYLIIAAIQMGAFAVAQAFLENALNIIRDALTTGEGQTKDEAESNIAIEIVSAAAALGLSAALIKSRLPLRWADKVINPKKIASLTPSGAANPASAAAGKAVTEKTKSFASEALKKLGISFAVSLPWLPSLVQNFLDQGTFNPKNANLALQAVGLGGVFQWPVMPKELQPGSYTAGEFLELFDQLTAGGAVGINNEFEQQSQLWTKDNLSQLINAVVGTLTIQGKKSDKTAIKAELSKYIITKTGIKPSIAAPVTTKGATLAAPRVFTGIITQGTLGAAPSFEARPDDLIENIGELQAAAQNNLAPFLASLPGRLIYELKIVSAVTTKDGFTQRGLARSITSGYTPDGSPKYRVVYNKFAVMNLYIMTEKKARTKIAQIILGPTDAIKFQPSQNDVIKVEETIAGSINTSNPQEIIAISVPAPVAPVTIAPQPAPTPTPTKIEDNYYKVRREGRAFVVEKSTNHELSQEEISARGININLVEERAAAPSAAPAPATAPISAPTQPVAPAPAPLATLLYTPMPKAGANATTLYEWYTANGKPLPSVAQRAPLYEKYGLGQAAYYTGTAEQNNKLLAALKTYG